MTTRVDILAPSRSDDSLLRRSRWVAERNRERLSAAGHTVVMRADSLCTERALRDGDPLGDGAAFFGHGLSDEIHGSDERPLFSGDAASRLRNRWIHAFACDAGGEWATRAVTRGGARVVAGYIGQLSANWSGERVPTEIADSFAEAVTAVTVALAEGVTDEAVLRARLEAPLIAITRWCDRHEGEGTGVRLLCEQLYNSLRVSSG